eukprot:tig00021489_g21688.t1
MQRPAEAHSAKAHVNAEYIGDDFADCGVFVLEYIERFRILQEPLVPALLGKNGALAFRKEGWFTVEDVMQKRSAIQALIVRLVGAEEAGRLELEVTEAAKYVDDEFKSLHPDPSPIDRDVHGHADVASEEERIEAPGLIEGRAERAARRSAGAGGSAVGPSSDGEAGASVSGGGGQESPLLRRRLLEAECAAEAARAEAARARAEAAEAATARASHAREAERLRRQLAQAESAAEAARAEALAVRGRLAAAEVEAGRASRQSASARRPLTASQRAGLAARVAELEGRLAGSLPGRLAEGVGALAAALVAARVAEATAALQRQADEERAARERAEQQQALCVACLERPPSVLLLPCRHMTVCDGCYDRHLAASGRRPHCPSCRVPINKRRSVRGAFLS